MRQKIHEAFTIGQLPTAIICFRTDYFGLLNNRAIYNRSSRTIVLALFLRHLPFLSTFLFERPRYTNALIFSRTEWQTR